MATTEGPHALLEQLAAAAEGSPQPGPRERLRRAMMHHVEGELGSAEAGYRSVLSEQPEDPVAGNNLGLLLAQRGDHRAATTVLERALEHAVPPSAVLLVNLANERFVAGRAADALALAEQAVVAQVDEPLVWRTAGRMRLAGGDLDGAERALRNACELGDRRPDTWVLWGAVLAGLGQLATAGRVLAGAVDLDPRRADAWHQLGLVRFARRDFGAAAEAFRTAIGLAPEVAAPHRQLGIVHAATGCVGEAITVLRAAPMIDHDAAMGIDLAVLLMATGDHDEAVDRCRAAAEVPTHRDRALLHLGYALLAAGREDEAVVAFHDVGGTAPFAERAREALEQVADNGSS